MNELTPNTGPTSSDDGADNQKPRNRLSSVTTAIHLLKQFTAEQAELGISALARNLGVSKSTVHRLASTLLAEGLLEQDPDTERYKLGLGLFTLGALVRQRMSVSTEAKPVLTELRRITKENADLAVLEGNRITYLYDFESPHDIHLRSRLGHSKPAIDCAEGIAILAFMPADESSKIVKTLGRSLRSQQVRAVHAELEIVRRRGVAVENETGDIGARCIAAPVRDATGAVAAAVGVAGPGERLTARVIESYIPHVVSAADRISLKLGYMHQKSAIA